MANHPAYAKSSLVQNAAAASRLIVTGSSYLSNMMTSGAESFTSKTKPVAKPMTFTETAHNRVRKINSATTSIAGFSASTVGKISDHMQNAAAKMAGKNAERTKGPKGDAKPGVLNKSMIAFSTVMDGIATSGKHLLTSGGAAATTVVGHRWGPEAGSMAADLAGGVKNVGLVYVVCVFLGLLLLVSMLMIYPGRHRRIPPCHHQIRRQRHDRRQSQNSRRPRRNHPRWRRRWRSSPRE